MKKCYYCGKKTQGAYISEKDYIDDKTMPREILVDICDKCLITHDYNPEDYK